MPRIIQNVPWLPSPPKMAAPELAVLNGAQTHRGHGTAPTGIWHPGVFVTHNDIVRRGPVRRQVLPVTAGMLLTVVLSPLIVVAGEPLRRHVLAGPAGPGWTRVRRRTVATYSWSGPGGFWLVLVSNPLWIALTAPGRWLADWAGCYRRRGRPGPPAAGVREPRRPRPGMSGGAAELAEPRATPVIACLPGTAMRGPGRRYDREDQGLRHWRHSRRD
jgi:hypothetical protein